MSPTTEKVRAGSTQARGRVRREQLIEAAKHLLDGHALEDISLADIAQAAGIPKGSAYHFFENAKAVFEALAVRFGEELDESLTQPYELDSDDNWQVIISQAVDRARAIYDVSPAYRQLIIGGNAPPDIKLSDRGNDEVVGEILMSAISRYFVLPEIPRATHIFFYAVEVMDLFLMLSMRQENRITDEMIAECKKAALAYLRVYLPSELPRRAAPVSQEIGKQGN